MISKNTQKHINEKKVLKELQKHDFFFFCILLHPSFFPLLFYRDSWGNLSNFSLSDNLQWRQNSGLSLSKLSLPSFSGVARNFSRGGGIFKFVVWKNFRVKWGDNSPNPPFLWIRA